MNTRDEEDEDINHRCFSKFISIGNYITKKIQELRIGNLIQFLN